MLNTIVFVFNSVLMGIGLAMDAFSVSAANALAEPEMRRSKMALIAGTFCAYQIAMPLIGWVCVHTVVEKFNAFSKFIPWIAFGLLAYIGGKMVFEGIEALKAKNVGDEVKHSVLGFGTLMLQGIATSIDALSVGFTIAELRLPSALAEAFIIGAVTYAICLGGLLLGKRIGKRLEGRASILGGLILIGIGLEIFIKGVFF